MDIQSTRSGTNQNTTTNAAAAAAASSASASTGTSSTTSTSTSTAAAQTDAGKANGESTVSSDFAEFMKNALGGASKTQVSEEELYSGIIQERLNKKSTELGTLFAQEKAKFLTSGNGSHEDAALKALNSAVASGKLTKEEAEKINGEAFSGAQLDSNLDSLFDDRGSATDTTIAIASIEEALTKSKAYLDAIASGTKSAESRSLETGPTGGSAAGSTAGAAGSTGSGSGASGSQGMDGSGGFVWKPESDSDGKLAVLVPSTYAGSVDRLEIHTSLPPSDSSKVEAGRYVYDSNGGRPTFRFSKPGDAYGDNLFAVLYKKDGSTAEWKIGDGGQRHD